MLQRRHRCALGAAFAFAAATFLLGLFFLPLPGGRLSSLTRFGAPLDSGGERPGTLEIVELERGRWKIVFSRIDPEAEGSFKPLGTWADKVAGERVEALSEIRIDDLAPIYSDFGDDMETEDKDFDLGPEGHRGEYGIAHDRAFASKLAGMSRKERAAETLRRLEEMHKPKVGGAADTQLNNLLALKKRAEQTSARRDKLVNGSLGLPDTLRAGVPKYVVKKYLSLPLPQYSLPVATVLRSQWVHNLQNFLSSHVTAGQLHPVSIVTATIEHEAVLMNWLISANLVASPPLENVLVLTLSVEIEETLRSKDIPLLYIDPLAILNSNGKSTIQTVFSRVHVVRLTVFRLLSHWGVNAVMYDADAIVLKNPLPLFESYSKMDIVGSAGRGPTSLLPAWGRTMCTGVLLMRGNEQMEVFWEKMASLKRSPFTDQGLVNWALNSLYMDWENFEIGTDEDMKGESRSGQLKAVILSEETICRYSCTKEKQKQYYVWHRLRNKGKIGRSYESKRESAARGGAWFLRDDWEMTIDSKLTGLEWLLAIAQLPVTQDN